MKGKFCLLLCVMFLCLSASGCFRGSPAWHNFSDLSEEELAEGYNGYSCRINETTSFWYNVSADVGEWKQEDKTFPFSIWVEGGWSGDPGARSILRFHDERGNCIAELYLEMKEYIGTTAKQSTCKAQGELELLSPQKCGELTELLSSLDMVGKKIVKSKLNAGDRAKVSNGMEEIFFTPPNRFFYIPQLEYYVFDVTSYYGYRAARQAQVLEGGGWGSWHITMEKDTVYLDGTRYVIHVLEDGTFDLIATRQEENCKAEYNRLKMFLTEDPFDGYVSFIENTASFVYHCPEKQIFFQGESKKRNMTGTWEQNGESYEVSLYTIDGPMQVRVRVDDSNKTVGYARAIFVEMTENGAALFKITDSEVTSLFEKGDTFTLQKLPSDAKS